MVPHIKMPPFEVLVIAPVEYVVFDVPGETLEGFEGVKLSDDFEALKQMIPDWEGFKKGVGEIIISMFRKGYICKKVTMNPLLPNNEKVRQAALATSDTFALFNIHLELLWLLQDCAARSILCYHTFVIGEESILEIYNRHFSTTSDGNYSSELNINGLINRKATVF